ncbi:MAG: gamma carbonic anhydrase family protein [Bdellovibrionaceae bacterium]|nr:gamma carbonic anhydrase family protein [Pseudobdellovibrionaceae bacterium]
MQMSLKGKSPQIAEDAFVAETADIIGAVSIGSQSSVWYRAVLRGDVAPITIGQRSNIQDGSVIHGSYNKSETIVEDDVTVGHGVILHGCHIQSHVLVGMGSVVMDNAIIPKNCIVGAGSLVTEGARYEEGSLIIGRPAKIVRKLTEKEIASLQDSANHYLRISSWYQNNEKE